MWVCMLLSSDGEEEWDLLSVLQDRSWRGHPVIEPALQAIAELKVFDMQNICEDQEIGHPDM